MVENFEMLMVEFTAKIETTKGFEQDNVTPILASKQDMNYLIKYLDKYSSRQSISKILEKDLEGYLGELYRQSYRVQVDIASVEPGSIAIIGTILVVGSVIRDVIWEAAKPPIVEVLQFFIKKALERLLPEWLRPPEWSQAIKKIEVAVTKTGSKEKQLVGTRLVYGKSSGSLLVPPGYFLALTLVNTLLLLILFILLVIFHIRIVP